MGLDGLLVGGADARGAVYCKAVDDVAGDCGGTDAMEHDGGGAGEAGGWWGWRGDVPDFTEGLSRVALVD